MGEGELSASEALFGFMGWLTSREEPVTFSEKHDASIAAELIDQYCQTNHLKQPRKDFHENLIYPIKEEV